MGDEVQQRRVVHACHTALYVVMQADMILFADNSFYCWVAGTAQWLALLQVVHHLGSPSLIIEGHPYDPDVQASAWLCIRHRHTDFCQWIKELLHGLVAAHPF